jgi:hypothetical protein
LLLSKDVLAEFLAQEDRERAWRLASAVMSLWRPPIMTLGFGGLFQLESKRSGILLARRRGKQVRLHRITQTPEVSTEERRNVTYALSGRDPFNSYWSELHQNSVDALKKEATHELDRDAREKALALRVRLEPESFRRDVLERYPYLLAEDRFTFFGALVPRLSSRNRMLRHPDLFSASLLWAMCQELSGYGVVQAASCPGAIDWLEGVRKNTWVDNKIAAGAAYADIFVTDEEKFGKRVNFSAKALGLRLRVETLDHFLATSP